MNKKTEKAERNIGAELIEAAKENNVLNELFGDAA